MVGSPNSYPCVDMYPGDLSRGTDAAAFGLDGEFLFTVRVRVQTNDADANQDLLLEHDGRRKRLVGADGFVGRADTRWGRLVVWMWLIRRGLCRTGSVTMR